MNGLTLMINIICREDAEEFTGFYAGRGIHCVYTANCRGTAEKKLLDLLGLEQKDKTILYAFVTGSQAEETMRALLREMKIDIPGRGIAMTLTVNSIGGERLMKYLSGERPVEEEEMDDKKEYDLLIAVAESGGASLVMDAARSAGATGGTVVHAKGTGASGAEKFFGVSIAEEKEMIFIVVHSRDRKAVMQAVMQGAGMSTPAKAFVLSLPVDDVAGLRRLDD